MTTPAPPTTSRVLLVATNGGHLNQLLALRPWWSRHSRAWVTCDRPDARSVLLGEQVCWAHHPTARNIPNLLRNLVLAWRELRPGRYDVVVSTGAGVALPFFVVARIRRVPTVYLEVYDRVDQATLSGRLCHPLASMFLVQWPDQLRLYPDAKLVGRLL